MVFVLVATAMAAAVAAVAVTAAMAATAAVQIAAAQIAAAVTVRSALKRGGNGGHGGDGGNNGGSCGQINDWREGNQHVATAATVINDRRWLWRARTMTAKSISKKGGDENGYSMLCFESNINFYVRDFGHNTKYVI